MYLLYRSNNFWNAPWKTSYVSVSMTFVTASFIPSIVRNCLDAHLGQIVCGKDGIVHCPGGNATEPIWRVLASSDGISSLTPLKPQHSIPCSLSVPWETSTCRSCQCCQEGDHQKFVGGFHLSGLLGSGRPSMLPLGTLSLGLCVIAVDPAFIAWHFYQV